MPGKWGFLCPWLKNQNSKIRKSKILTFFDFSMPVSSRYKAQKNNISGIGDFTHQANTSFQSPVQTQESRFSDHPIQGELYFPIDRSC